MLHLRHQRQLVVMLAPAGGADITLWLALLVNRTEPLTRERKAGT